MKRRKVKIFAIRLLFAFFAFAIIPLIITLILNLKILFENLNVSNPKLILLIVGFVIYIGFFVLAGPPKRIYILQHELTHAIGAILSGVRIKEFRIKRGSGYVRTERINIFITLLPYAFPLYSFILVLIFRVLSMFISLESFEYVFYFFVGLSLSFHTSATFYYMLIDQPDLKRYGIFPSIVLIMLWYILLTAILIYFLIPQINILGFIKNSFNDFFIFYRYLFGKIVFLYGYLYVDIGNN